MLLFLNNISVLESIIILLISALPGILILWLIIEIIRYLRRH